MKIYDWWRDHIVDLPNPDFGFSLVLALDKKLWEKSEAEKLATQIAMMVEEHWQARQRFDGTRKEGLTK